MSFTPSGKYSTRLTEQEREDLQISVAQRSLQQGQTGLKGFSTGIAQSGIGFARGTAQVLQGLGQRGLAAVSPKSLEEVRQETGFKSLDDTTKEGRGVSDILQPESKSEKAGKFVGDVALFAVPTARLKTIGQKMAAAAGVATGQEGEVGAGTVVAGATEGALPLVGKAVKGSVKLGARLSGKITKRLLRGLGADVDAIADNPEAIKRSLEALSGAEKADLTNLVRKNADSIMQGIGTIKRDARKAFGEGLEKLDTVGVDPDEIGSAARGVAKKFNINIEALGRGDTKKAFSNVDFGENSQAVKKATEAINAINSAKSTTGKSLRKLFNKIESLEFKNIGGNAERGDLNAFLNEMSSSLRETLTSRSDLLKVVNKEFTGEMQLAEAIEQLFGRQKFRSEAELQKIAEKLPNVLKKSGVSEQNVDRFLSRIGIEPTEFRATEAVRGAFEQNFARGAEKAGFFGFVAEIFREATAGTIDPVAATRFAAFLETLPRDKAINIVKKLDSVLSGTAEAVRPVLIESLTEIFSQDS